MSADHRKPVVAFVLLALAATALIGAQRAEAQRGQFLAAVIAAGGQGEAVHGLIRPTSAEALEVARARVATLGPVFVALADGSGRVTTLDTAFSSALMGSVDGTGLTSAFELGGGEPAAAAGGTPGGSRRPGDGTEAGAQGGSGPRTTGGPTTPREPLGVRYSDGSTRRDPRPRLGDQHPAPTTVVRPSQAGDRTARERPELRRERRAAALRGR